MIWLVPFAFVFGACLLLAEHAHRQQQRRRRDRQLVASVYRPAVVSTTSRRDSAQPNPVRSSGRETTGVVDTVAEIECPTCGAYFPPDDDNPIQCADCTGRGY